MELSDSHDMHKTVKRNNAKKRGYLFFIFRFWYKYKLKTKNVDEIICKYFKLLYTGLILCV
jgi:hypothetical protein